MTEEQVTRAIISELAKHGWAIISYDFPQSGSGKMLHPDWGTSEKNKGGIIPDIITIKGTICLFFENKDRVVIEDFQKVSSLIKDNRYTSAIADILDGKNVQQIYYGVGFPSAKWNNQAVSYSWLVNFIVGVTEDYAVEFLHNPHGLMI